MAAATIAIGLAAGTAIAGTVAAHKAANATKAAAKMQVDSNDSAAKIQAASAADELAFKRRQAEVDWQNSQQTARANYDQWAAGRGRLRSLGAMTGIDLGPDPAFVPGIDPRFDGSGAPVPGGPAPGAPAASAGPVDGSQASIAAFFKSKGVSDHETPYWVSKWPELVARGKELNDPNYAMKRLAAADVFGGGGGRVAPKTAAPAPVSMASLAYAPTPTSPILAPGVTGMADAPYTVRRPYSFADMVR